MFNELESYNSLPEPSYSKNHRKRINRIFREIMHFSTIPYPEVDNLFERFRSKLALKIPFIRIKNRR